MSRVFHSREGRDNSPGKRLPAADKIEGTAALRKVDVRGTYTFREYREGAYSYKEEANVRLGTPGKVVEHRPPSAQNTVSKGIGDNAGHLIDNRFGAPSVRISARRTEKRIDMGPTGLGEQLAAKHK